jgi:uncharacterized protein (DUF983 family)
LFNLGLNGAKLLARIKLNVMGKLISGLSTSCPRCNKGPIFKASNPYSFGNMMVMKSHCDNCGLRYERETGFFYGAMFVSYGINIALFAIALIMYYSVFEISVDWKVYIAIYVLVSILLTPIIFRLSRSLWLALMVNYDPEKRGER